MSLKEKTLRGLTWSFVDSSFSQVITFIVGIVLARLVSPAEFGVLAFIFFFISISESLIDSGFGTALIRKKDCTTTDFSTVFYFNLIVSITIYIILYLSAPLVESYFNVHGLALILRVTGCVLIFNALGYIQQTLLSKRIDFKTLTKITVITNLLAGILAIVLAYKGFGVWSLVWRILLGTFFSSLFLWVFNNWRPKLVFSIKSFKELFGFGYKMALAGLIDTIYSNIMAPIIGKIYSPETLGQYERAQKFPKLFSSTLTRIIQRVTYPVLSTIQDDPEKLKSGYRKMIKSTMLITFTCMIGLVAIAKPLILILIGEQWLPCIPFMQLICLKSMFYPLHAMNLNIIMVKGRSDLFLKLEVIKKIMYTPNIFVGIYFGVVPYLIGGIILSIVAYLLNSYYSADLIRYSSKEQILDILPFLLISVFVWMIIWCITFFEWNNWITIFFQVGAGSIFTIGIFEMLNQPDYREVKHIALHFLIKNFKKKSITQQF